MLERHYFNIYRMDTRNVGDRMSAPSLYFDLGHVRCVDVKSLSRRSTSKQNYSNTTVVLGGGGLFIWQDRLRPLFEDPHRRPMGGKLFVWGAGLNDHNKIRDRLPTWTAFANLVGVRDIKQGFPWVPCVSCMSPAFDLPRESRHEVVIYDHHDSPVPVVLPDVPRKSNFDFTTISQALDFLGSADIVLTSTYHGVYWSILLGKKVIVWPFASRFHYMKHPPVLASGNSWGKLARTAIHYPEALEECRTANRAMHEKVMNSLSA